MTAWITIVVAAITLLASCAARESPGSLPEGSSNDQDSQCLRRERLGFVDRAADINPTPTDMTAGAIRVLHSAIARTRTETGRFPGDLDELLARADQQHPFPPRREWLIDGWGNRLYYTAADSTYTLASAGADGTLGTEDDIRSAGPLTPC